MHRVCFFFRMDVHTDNIIFTVLTEDRVYRSIENVQSCTKVSFSRESVLFK
jgi:hypothetical protein